MPLKVLRPGLACKRSVAGVGVFGVDLACGGVDEEGGFIPVAEMVRDVVFLAVCAWHVGDGGLQITKGYSNIPWGCKRRGRRIWGC